MVSSKNTVFCWECGRLARIFQEEAGEPPAVPGVFRACLMLNRYAVYYSGAARLFLIILLMTRFVCAAYAQQFPVEKTKPVLLEQTEQQDVDLPESEAARAAPVVPFHHQPIFYIYARLGPFTPAERAERLESTMRQLAAAHDFSSEKMEIVTTGGMLDIVYNGIIVMSVADADAEYIQKTKKEVAEHYRDNIISAINQYRKDTGLVSMLSRAGLILLILALFFFIIRYLNHLHKFARRKIVLLRGTMTTGIRIKSYSLLDEDKCIVSLLFLVKIIRYAAIIVILFFLLPLLFSVFPETRGLAGKLLEYVLSPFTEIVIAVRDYLPKAVAIAVIVTIFHYVGKAIKYFASEIEKEKLVIKGFYSDWALPTSHIVRMLLCAFMFIVIFQYLPYSESRVFQGVSVFIGILISLGSTALIGNLVSGMVLTYMRPFRTGDFIKIGDILGTVKERTPFAIRIMTTKNEEVVFPNSNIMSSHTTNYSRMALENKLILHTVVTFGYDTPWRQVHELLLSAAARTPHVLADPAPFVLQRALDNYFAEYQINVYVIEEKLMSLIYSELYQNVQDVFKEAGLDMTCLAYHGLRGENHIRVTK